MPERKTLPSRRNSVAHYRDHQSRYSVMETHRAGHTGAPGASKGDDVKRMLLSSLRVAVATVAAMALTLVAGETPALAALPEGYRVETSRFGDNVRMEIFNPGGTYIGLGLFQADPSGTVPGDAILACDEYADGLGVEMRMDINPGSSWQTDRVASTRGHNSPYCDGWKTGDIAEGTRIGVKVCLVSGSVEYCTGVQYSYA
jgi:hypothetical protein